MADTLSINKFYQELTTNGVRLSHQFRLTFTTPVDLSLLTIYARGATIPALKQNSADVQYYAYPLKVPTNFSMDQVLTFQCLSDAQMDIRAALLTWVGLHSNWNIEGGGSGQGIKQTPSSAVDINIDILDNDFETIIDTIVLVGAFPTNVGGFEVSHENANVVTFPVDITFQYWKAGHGMPSAIESRQGLLGGLATVLGNVSAGVQGVAGIARAAKSIGKVF